MDTRTHFLTQVEAICRETGVTERQLGVRSVGNPKIINRIRRGSHVTTETIERIEGEITKVRQERAAGDICKPAAMAPQVAQ